MLVRGVKNIAEGSGCKCAKSGTRMTAPPSAKVAVGQSQSLHPDSTARRRFLMLGHTGRCYHCALGN